ncbi:glycosyltransferase [Microvirga calopogonii]|uniref:glycosyltransferase n=1 Tax=Microvirga calopogonii TaxID=2078013 RepID=UPI0013B4102E|nr:glycosyltransferase [Microvirga calopogonii]
MEELAHKMSGDERVYQKPMREILDVVLIIDDLGIGGAQRVLEVQLRAMLNGPYSIRVINLSGPSAASDRIRAMGIELVEIHQRNLYDQAAWKKLKSIILQWRPKVIHAHLTHATIVGAILSRMVGARFIVTLHSQGPESNGWRTRVKNGLERLALSYGSDHIVACGPRVAKLQYERVGRTPVSVIENRVERPPGWSSDVRSQVRSSLGYEPRDIVMISVGRLTVAKGFDILIRAFSKVNRSSPSAKLLIVGGGDDHDRLVQIIREVGAEEYVQLTGARADVGKLMAAADVFVLSSLWEGLPMVLLEAVAAGLPVIATDVGDVSTVIRDGAGILVPPADEEQLAHALSEVASKSELRASLAERGNHLAKRYTDLDGFSQELHSAYAHGVQ